MFTVMLLTIANIWRQPKCLTMDDYIKKIWCVCVYTHIFSHKKQGDITIVTTWTELEGFMLSKITEIGKYPMISLRYGIFFKRGRKQAHRYREQISVCQRWGLGSGQNRSGESKCTNFQL